MPEREERHWRAPERDCSKILLNINSIFQTCLIVRIIWNHLELVKHTEFPTSTGDFDSVGPEFRPWILNKTLEHFKLNT